MKLKFNHLYKQLETQEQVFTKILKQSSKRSSRLANDPLLESGISQRIHMDVDIVERSQLGQIQGRSVLRLIVIFESRGLCQDGLD